MDRWVDLCVGGYRRLARAFPQEFWIVYGEEMEQLGEDAAPEIFRRYGFFGLVRLLADIALRLPAEYASELRRDLAYAVRMIAKAPGYAATAILSLGLGIGLSSLVFTYVNSLMLRPLPGVVDADALVAIEAPLSYPDFEEVRLHREIAAAAGAFIGPVAFAVQPGASGVETERILGQLVSPDYFAVLGLSPARGRFFDPAIEGDHAAPVVVISDRFWRARLGGDPNVVGRTLRVNGQLATIVGVTPSGFQGVYPRNPADLFVPATADKAIAAELSGDTIARADRASFRVFVRLADRQSVRAAESALAPILRSLRDARLGVDENRERQRRPLQLMPAGTLMPLNRSERIGFRIVAAVLIGLIVTLTSANLAGIVLARGGARSKEIAIRLAAGASRFRLVRQLLAESGALGLAGGVVGLGFTYVLLQLSVSLTTTGNALGVTPEDYQLHPDWRVALFTFVCGALTGIASGLMPALATTRPDITPALKEDDTIVLRPFRRFGLRNGLVVYQVSAAVMLLLAIGFVVVGSQRGRQLNPGFDMANLYTFALDPPRDGYSASESAVVFGELRRRLARLPDVRAIAYASRPPLSDFMVAADLPIRVPHDGSETVTVNVDRQQVGAGYFAAIGVPVVMGREFTENDQKTDPDPGKVIEPVVINQLAARDMFGSGDPIGKHVRLGAATLEVIGVTRDMRSGFFSAKPVPTMFWPLTTRDFERSSAAGLAVVFTGGGPDPIDAARAGMHAMDPRLTMHRPATLRQLLDQMGTTVRRGNIMNALIGVLAMILAAVGLAGVISHTVARRRHEIGVRMALGARPYQVVRLVVKEGLVMLAVGSMAGFAGALAIANAIGATSSQMADVFSASINDPALSLGVPAVLLVSAAIVCYVPARRSTRIDPAATLRA